MNYAIKVSSVYACVDRAHSCSCHVHITFIRTMSVPGDKDGLCAHHDHHHRRRRWRPGDECGAMSEKRRGR